LSIVTTTRKFFTVLASIFFYSHAVNGTQWASIALVFVGVALELINESTKKHGATKELPVKKESEGVELSTTDKSTTIRKEDETDKLKWWEKKIEKNLY